MKAPPLAISSTNEQLTIEENCFANSILRISLVKTQISVPEEILKFSIAFFYILHFFKIK